MRQTSGTVVEHTAPERSINKQVGDQWSLFSLPSDAQDASERAATDTTHLMLEAAKEATRTTTGTKINVRGHIWANSFLLSE